MFVLQAHGGGDAVARGFNIRMPLRCQNRELATPRGKKPPTHATISSDNDGISAPIRKSPPHATSEPSPPPSNDTFLLIDPPNALSTLIKREGAREDTTKLSNQREIKFVPMMDHDKSTHFPFPPAPRTSARDNNATKRRYFANQAMGTVPKAVAAGAEAVGRVTSLHCPEHPGAVPGIGCCDGGVASQRVGHPLSLPRIGLHAGAAHGDHRGVG